MPHLSSFKVHGYRGLGDFAIGDLAPVNLFTGPNGIGKTSLLEAILLFHSRFQAASLWHTVIQRSEMPVTNPLKRLAKREFVMEGVENGAARSLAVQYEPKSTSGQSRAESTGSSAASDNGSLAGLLSQGIPIVGALHVSLDGQPPDLTGWVQVQEGIVLTAADAPIESSAVFVAGVAPAAVKKEMVPDFSKVIADGDKGDFKKDLRSVLPLAQDFEIVTDKNNTPYILATLGGGSRFPLESLGSGLKRLFFLLLSVRMARGGALLIDEINSEFHHSVLEDLWRRIRTLASRLEVQLFVTTHSLECVDAAIAAFEDSPDDLAVHNLRSRSHESPVRAVTFRGESLQGAREINLEVR